MAEFPEIARRRLSRMMVAGNHPDPGLLTAFIEGSLIKCHRRDVLNHLAGCSECNRMVALIATRPELAVAQPAKVPIRGFVFTPWRWASLAATTAVLVCAFVIGRIEWQTRTTAHPAAAVVKAPPSNMTAQAPVPATVQPAVPRFHSKPSQRILTSHEAEQSARVSGRQGSLHSAPAITSQGRAVTPSNLRDHTAYETSMLSSADFSREPRIAVPTPSMPQVKVERAPAVSANVPAAIATPTAPVWSVSERGMLKKSNDGGHTWRTVLVPSRVPLRALAVLGQDIWIGGDHGALYHSTDGGETWTSVVAKSNRATLSNDIARIAFSDLYHGWIATRNGEIWTTHDAGATWFLK